MNMTISEGCAVLPPEAKKKEIPLYAVWLLMGAKVHKTWKGKKDAAALELEGELKELSEFDLEAAKTVAERVSKRLTTDKVVSAKQSVAMYRWAVLEAEKEQDTRTGNKGIAMLKDKGGCGYWRMILPARYMDKTGIYIDVTAASVRFEHLVEYDTIYVQRLHDWDSYYMLEKLKAIGKRIVYDIDDDIFNLTPDNPAFHIIGRDQQMAAAACMKLADAVVTTTEELASRLDSVMDGKHSTVIPNALDTDDGWQPTPLLGSPDGVRRIFWQGSATHAEDWMECAEAVDKVMEQTTDVRLTILGFLPPVVQMLLNKPYWKNRVEYLPFNDPETYFQIVKHVRAEVGLAPLKGTVFNAAKSSIRWLEYSLIGIPTVASGCKPYSDIIEENEDGLLSYDTNDWFECIMRCLNDKAGRLGMVERARRKARLAFNIKDTVKQWREVLIP